MTTGIPSITVYVTVSPALRLGMLAMNLLAPLLSIPAIRNRALARAGAVIGPDAAAREWALTLVWGEARNAAGVTRTARLRTANGYELTIHGALAVVRHVMETAAPASGFTTSSLLCGTGLVERHPGPGKIMIS